MIKNKTKIPMELIKTIKYYIKCQPIMSAIECHPEQKGLKVLLKGLQGGSRP